MNREQSRAFVKKSQKDGMSKQMAQTYAQVVRNAGICSPRDFSDGDKIQLNAQLIKGRKNYERMSTMYKEFVESNEDEIFTAQVEHKNLISLAEEPKWLFWSGDLIKVDKCEAIDDE